MIVKTMPVGPIGTNCYLLGDETSKACAMIDPGGDPDDIHDPGGRVRPEGHPAHPRPL